MNYSLIRNSYSLEPSILYNLKAQLSPKGEHPGILTHDSGHSNDLPTLPCAPGRNQRDVSIMSHPG